MKTGDNYYYIQQAYYDSDNTNKKWRKPVKVIVYKVCENLIKIRLPNDIIKYVDRKFLLTENQLIDWKKETNGEDE